MTNKDIGNSGEDKAVEFLVTNKYSILVRNYRYKRCEIDIIAMSDSDCVCFIEVKTRSSKSFGYPEEFVDEHQKQRIYLAADNYLYENHWDKNIRFDIISILKINNIYNIEHIIDAF